MAYQCSVCGEIHHDFPAFSFSSPYYYHILSEEDQATMAELSEDWCIIRHDTQTDYFIRAVLELPVTGTAETFQYGVWVSLSEKNFEYYMDNLDETREGDAFFGYLCNRIPGYENTLATRANIVCGPKGQRPHVFPHGEQDHAFVRDFIQGISPEEADRRIHLLLKR